MILDDKVIVVDSFAPPTAQQLIDFEWRNQLQLPREYVQFLLETNGGIPNTPATLPILDEDNDPIFDVSLLYAMAAEIDYFDLDSALSVCQSVYDMSGGLLPIANDAGGNQYCVKSPEHDKSEVWFLDHENGSLVEKVADSFASFRNSLYCNPMYWRESIPIFRAVERGRTTAARDLLTQGKACINDTNSYGWSLLTCASFNGHPPMCKLLLEMGAHVDAADEEGRTPLMSTQSVDVAKVLLAAGANINARAEDGSTPLLLALESEAERLAIELIAQGADIRASNARGDSPHSLCEQANPYVKSILDSRR